ncbi:MAG: nicotinamide-nucleotide amidohydrolase family protein [Bacilli bacterium]
MNCAILSIGDEVVDGYVLNSNASFFAQQLNEIGIKVEVVLTIRDQQEMIIKTIKQLSQYDLVICSGGLGPTNDDITKESIALALGLELKLNHQIHNALIDSFIDRNMEYNPINDKQALFSDLDHIINNENGSADGYYFTLDQTTYCILPGPPSENRPIFNKFLDVLVTSKPYIYNLYIYGIGESISEGLVSPLYLQYQDVFIGSYIQKYGIIYRIKASDKDRAKACFNDFKKALQPYYLGDFIDPIASLVQQLIKLNLTISTSESCTGGLVSATLVEYPNVSSIFNESIITYSNESKVKYLNVSTDTLLHEGAVSAACANEMALGLETLTKSAINISVTGLAGPSGGSESKPIGLVFFAIVYNGVLYSFKQNFRGNRQEIRTRATHYILFELLKLL